MKRKQRKKSKTVLSLMLLFCLLAGIQYYFQQPKQQPQPDLQGPFVDALKYSPVIQEELEKVHLATYTPVLVAIMQQESHGKGGDPMQASESAGFAKDAITDPVQSIEAGVSYFHRVLTYGNEKKVDFPTIIQSYNMGIGYIDYVAAHGGKHSEELAKQFSNLQVQKNPQQYNCGGDKTNFRYPYCYGDFTYSTKVLKNMELLADTMPVAGNKDKTGKPF
ncbi:lysozyme family protein [Neobacillus dielmonensis]|uniref:lysozyme family protein n=1 Tax=Neobacillus dielmonensis TaxID=1347369 RepID=UPI0005A8BF1E|nr:lysozyme family protein [Neobacillus dielmonensis]